MVDIDYLLATTLATPGMHIAALDGPLATAEALSNGRLLFRFRNSTPKSTDEIASIWTPNYEPGTFVSLKHAADTFPEGGLTGFQRWFKSRCVLSRTDAISQHHGQDEIWRKFAACFEVLGSVIHYEPIWRAFLRRLMSLLAADGVSWVELR